MWSGHLYMQILYCDSCGAKLPELDVPTNRVVETEVLKKAGTPAVEATPTVADQVQEKQTAYDPAMKRVVELLAAKKLEEAAAACEEVLKARPDDKEAIALLAEVRRQLEAVVFRPSADVK